MGRLQPRIPISMDCGLGSMPRPSRNNVTQDSRAFEQRYICQTFAASTLFAVAALEAGNTRTAAPSIQTHERGERERAREQPRV